MNDAQINILLFDGVCNLCNGLVKFIIKRDTKNIFKFASLQSEAGKDRLKILGLKDDEIKTVVLIQGDKFYDKSTAVLKLLQSLGGPWKLFYGFIIVPRFLRDFFYDLIAISRYKIFGKRDTCMIPTPEMDRKFL